MSTQCHTGQHDHHDVYEAQCPCRAMLDLLANKWSALAIGALEDGPLRFGALQRRLQGISPKVLTQTLRRLEDAGLIERTVYPAVPLHVEYELSPWATARPSRSGTCAGGSRTTWTSPPRPPSPCDGAGPLRRRPPPQHPPRSRRAPFPAPGLLRRRGRRGWRRCRTGGGPSHSPARRPRPVGRCRSGPIRSG